MVEERIVQFIADKNRALNLGLNDFQIRELASDYYAELQERDLTYIDDEMFSDEIFDTVFEEFDKEAFSDDVLYGKVPMKEDIKGIQDEALENEDKEATMMLKDADEAERRRNAHNGYGYSDSFDDRGLDEESEDESMQIRM